MKQLVVILFLFSFISIFAQANENYNGVKPETIKGAKALVFSYTPFQSNLGGVPITSLVDEDQNDVSMQGIALKYFVSKKMSVIGGFSFGSMTTTGEDIEVGFSALGFSGDINLHLPSLYNISTYVGGNLSLGLYGYDYEDDEDDETREFSSASFSIGVNIGFDWYFSEGIALGGKYTIGYTSFSEPEFTFKRGDFSTTTDGEGSSHLGTGVGSIVLSVHF